MISAISGFLNIFTHIYRYLKRSFNKEDSATADVIKYQQKAHEETLVAREQQLLLHKEFLAVRDQVSLLQKEKGDLAKQLADKMNFEDERDKFVRAKLDTGSVVYVEKEHEKKPDDEKFHFCANCFDNGKKSAITISKHDSPHDIYKCPACGTEVFISHNRDEDII